MTIDKEVQNFNINMGNALDENGYAMRYVA
jgi:hypothetical protein